MSVKVEIKSVDRTDRVDVQSLKIQNILTNKVDKCSFIIKTYGDKTYKPDLGNEVVVYRDAVKIFAGNILSIENAPEALGILGFKVNCVDYTRGMDGVLVTEVYENQTVNAIIADLAGRYASGYTITNVDCTETIEYISFNYQTMSSVLADLAKRYNYDWYVDYDKDIHFFSKETNPAPFDLNDDDGSYVYESLEIRKDNSQVKNVIIVEGGEYLANTLTSDIECSGVDRIFNIGYKFDQLEATLSTTALNIGMDFSADPDDVDVLWNRDEKVLKFKDADKPSASSELKIVGRPYLPVLVKKYDSVSVQAMMSAEGGTGEKEYYINDATINSKEGAIERASAELYGYANSISEGSFITENDGLRSGQQIRIVSAIRGIDEFYIINKVTMQMRTSDKILYQVSIVTTRTFGMIELLQKLLKTGNNTNLSVARKILNLIQGADENITLTEDIESSLEHNPIGETTTMDETLTVQSIDYETKFVLGPFSKIDGLVEDSQLLSRWKLNERAESTLVTDSKAGHNGTAARNTILTASEFELGTMYNGNGSSDRITIPHHADLHQAASFTFTCWFKPNTITGNHGIIGKGGAYIVWQLSDKIRFNVYNGVDYSNYAESAAVLVPDTLYFLRALYDSTNTRVWILIYDVNGKQLSAANNTTTLSYAGTNDLYIGNWGTAYLDGGVADVRLWNAFIGINQIRGTISTKQRNFILNGSRLA